MPRWMARLARPALLAGAGLLALRLAAWPVQDAVAPPLRLTLTVLAVALLVFALIGAGFAPPGARHRNLVAWLSVIVAIVAIPVIDRDYDDWQYRRIWGDAGPPDRMTDAVTRLPADGEIVLDRHADGHYYMDAAINGASVNFLVDTGASVLALSLDDARRVGIRVEALDFVHPVSTAAGQTMAAGVMVRRLEIAGHEFETIPALVLRGSRQSLMGMSVLERFSSLEIREDRLILQP